MSFPVNDAFGLKKSGLVQLCYNGNYFYICKIAKWAYMAIVVVADTTNDEDKPSLIEFDGWLIDDEFGKKIMENNALFMATMLSKKTERAPDLHVTVTYDSNPLEDILREVESGVRKPVPAPQLERIFKEQRTQELKKTVDRFGETPQISDKKVWPGIIMLLLYPLGVPFFYFHLPVLGIVMPVAFIMCCIFPVVSIPVGLLGCVFIVITLVRLFGLKLRDKEGRIICTKKARQKLMDNVAEYKKNVIELRMEDENT